MVNEITTLTQALQVGVESVPGSWGTSVAANRRLKCVTGFDVDPMNDVDMSQRPTGHKAPIQGTLGREWTAAAVTGVLTYTDFVYLLNMALAQGVIAAGGDASSRYHSFNWAQYTGEAFQSLTIEHGSADRAHKLTGCLMPDLNWEIARGPTPHATFGGNIMGKPLLDAITLTASPTDLSDIPIDPNDVVISIDPTFANLGTTKYLRPLKIAYSMGGHWDQIFPVDSALARAAAAPFERPPAVQVKLLLEADAQGMGLLTSLRSKSLQALRVLGTGPAIGASFNHFQWDLMCEWSDLGAPHDENGVFCVEATADMTYDPTGAANQRVRIENAITAL